MALLEIANFLHFLGLAFGLGGATIASIISAKSEKDKELGKQIGKIFPSIVKLIWIGLILLIISGIAISFLITWPLNRQLLIIKHILVLWIVIFGVSLGVKMGKMKKLMLMKDKDNEIIKTRKLVKTLSIINLFLWYAVTLLSAFV